MNIDKRVELRGGELSSNRVYPEYFHPLRWPSTWPRTGGLGSAFFRRAPLVFCLLLFMRFRLGITPVLTSEVASSGAKSWSQKVPPKFVDLNLINKKVLKACLPVCYIKLATPSRDDVEEKERHLPLKTLFKC